MCTVTLVAHDFGVRLICNRDERRDRAPARPPARVPIAGRGAAFPVDPESGGTWIGVNDAGLAAALLNWPLAARQPETRSRRSRGLIVPRLLACAGLETVERAVGALDARPYRGFRIVAVQGRRAIVAAVCGTLVSVERFGLTGPRMLTSSSVRPDRALAARRALFRRLVVGANGASIAAQRAFHRHRWPSEPGISIVMARPESRTVSRTVVDLGPAEICLAYEPLEPEPDTVPRDVRL